MAAAPEQVNCDICRRDSRTTPASAFCIDCGDKLCEQCNIYHKRNKASSSHTIHEITGIKDIETFNSLKCLTQCKTHVQKKVKYLCKNHDQLCCNECAIVKHRKCENIVSIADEIEAKAAKYVSSTLDVLKQLDKSVDVLLAHEVTDQIANDATEFLCRVALEKLKKNLEHSYSMLHDKLTEDAKAKVEKITQNISEQKKELRKYEEKLTESTEKVATVKRIGQKIHLYLTERDLQHQMSEYKNEMKHLHQNANNEKIAVIETSSEKSLTQAIEKFIQVNITDKTVILPEYFVQLTYEETKCIDRKQKLELDSFTSQMKWAPNPKGPKYF